MNSILKSEDISRKIEDIDAKNAGNIFEAPQYAFDIFENMKEQEKSYSINASYMSDIQTEVTPDMRTILIDWMNQVSYFISFGTYECKSKI